MMNSIEHQAKKKQPISGAPLVLGYIGLITAIIGMVMVIPLISIAFHPAEFKYMWNFLVPAAVMITGGFTLYFTLIFHKEHGQLANHQDAFIVLVSWLIAILGTSVPFWSSGILNFHQSIFEITSGWTTTGLTVFDVEQGDVTCFLWLRVMSMFFGGIGIILIMISVFSDRYGMRLYSAEGHGDRFLPNLIRSARMMFVIYIGLIIAGTIAFLGFGMTPFDALSHAITGVATGGFSNYNDSIGHYSIANGYSVVQICGIQVTALVMMLSGSISFISWSFFFRGHFKTFFKSFETHIQALVLSIAIPLVFIAVLVSNTVAVNNAFMYSIFYACSAITTCGFQITSLSADTFPAILLILAFLMLIGSQSSSTSGGMKIGRLSLFFHSVFIKIRNSLSPLNTHHPDYVNVYDTELYLDHDTLHDNNVFVISYFAVYFIGVLIFTFSGVPISQAIFETASMIGTVGLSTNMVTLASPIHYYYVASAIMFLGRLEIFMVLYGIIYIARQPIKLTRSLLARRR